MRIGIYPGSFDPITIGHLDVIKRSSKLVDKLIIGVLNNQLKNSLFTVKEREDMIKTVTKDIPNVEVDSFAGLLVDFAKYKNANIVVRGLRAVTDFEYELQMAQTNQKLNENIETIFLTTSVEWSYLSSSVVKEIGANGGKVDIFVPECIVDAVNEKFKNIGGDRN